jgi:hypothetical protein
MSSLFLKITTKPTLDKEETLSKQGGRLGTNVSKHLVELAEFG